MWFVDYAYIGCVKFACIHGGIGREDDFSALCKIQTPKNATKTGK
jgi:hypothetical protein